MRNLYIFNYQREIPPFMQMQIGIARNYFDKIVYVTRKMTNDNSNTINYDNVKVVQVRPIVRGIQFVISFIKGLFNPYIIRASFGEMDIRLLKALITDLFTSDCLYATGKTLISTDLKVGAEVYLLSTWFASEALTVARLNKEFHPQKAVSFAHSFEIDPDKNRYVAYSFNDFKHNNIDEVYYISNRMKEIYYKTTEALKIKEKYDSKSKIVYLGSTKKFDGINTLPNDGKFHIVSCSGVTPVKRIHLIAEALKDWNKCQICWTHLGGGPLFEKIKTLANNVMKANPKVTIILEGQKDNTEVQEYYTKHSFDVFVNVSAAEGLPVSIMEAMSYGIPCIATNVGGTSEIVTNETGVLLSKECTPAEIGQALVSYANTTPEQRNNYRKNARHTWQEHFDTNNTMREFYANMISE